MKIPEKPKTRINNFVEDLNHRKIVLFVGTVDEVKLYHKLIEDQCSYMYRWGEVIHGNCLMYIANCDLQTVYDPSELAELFHDHYTLVPLEMDNDGFYVKGCEWLHTSTT